MTSTPPEQTHGTVAFYVEQLRRHASAVLDSAVLGAVEGAFCIGDDTLKVQHVRAALAAANIVRDEQRAAREIAQAELHELAEPSPLAPPSDRATKMAGNRARLLSYGARTNRPSAQPTDGEA